MKCSHICEWNGWGQNVSCFRPAGKRCPLVMTVEEFDQKAKADSMKTTYDMWVREKSCLVCATSPDGGVHCDHGPWCKRGKYWTKMPFEDFAMHMMRREKNDLHRTSERAQEAKADGGKLQIHMVPMQIVRDVAEVRMYGTKKYGDENNWRKVELIRYVDAMLRHTLAFVEDIHSVDEESGIPHYKHAECNWSFISQLMHEGKCPPKKECVADGRAGSQAADAPGE